jgi:hypothetical protein
MQWAVQQAVQQLMQLLQQLAKAGLMSLISDHTPDWYAWFVETCSIPQQYAVPENNRYC